MGHIYNKKIFMRPEPLDSVTNLPENISYLGSPFGSPVLFASHFPSKPPRPVAAGFLAQLRSQEQCIRSREEKARRWVFGQSFPSVSD